MQKHIINQPRIAAVEQLRYRELRAVDGRRSVSPPRLTAFVAVADRSSRVHKGEKIIMSVYGRAEARLRVFTSAANFPDRIYDNRRNPKRLRE